ncbi:hypothetical protein Q4610_14310 [Sphingobium sp. HBC34]|uniref:Ig-like domain-containing protein n=1 Tax=Sphingobium cyanobacteriorum TaxID=3063954 RepID=A0ABT8ZNV3_9SPHN|nr:hypothetical protein [Sphingobium sp. HBC34]MDO7836219.1 hypothetical protein [Sphingobium sp. HBC34]
MKATASGTAILMVLASPVQAQNGIHPRDVVTAAIASDIARDRQAERDATRTPYASPGYGRIGSAAAARDACAAKALQQAGRQAKLIGRPSASSMSTGWEVEGAIALPDGGDVPFVCSVRNGSVSGVLLRW